MLHEILLSLSGLQSPIWNQEREPDNAEAAEARSFNQYVSPPERAMLDTLGHLHDLHIKIRDGAARSATNPSMVCRAVGSSIIDAHLGRFMEEILKVEALMLKKDAGFVGAYDIVPLSTVVAEFAPWARRLEWLWSVVQRLEPASRRGNRTRAASGAALLAFLERETRTGYADIEDMAVALLEVAQRTWMRTASLWILSGKVPAYGVEDFCITANPTSSSTMNAFSIDPALTPPFVNPGAARALLSAGSALNQLRSQNLSATGSLQSSEDPSLLLMPIHARVLQSLSYPLDPLLFENVLSSIHQSISENALSQILPRTMVMQLLQVILRYMLLDHGEFAVSLVAHADERVSNRQSRTVARPVRKTGKLDDLSMQDVELNGILNKAMSDLAALQADDDLDYDIWSLAKRLLSLRPAAETPHRSRLISTLLPTPTSLCITIPPSSPLHIFLSAQDAQMYAVLNAYLLSIRRAGLHLSELWKLSYHRRCYPAPVAPPRSFSRTGQASTAKRRLRNAERTARTRRHWTCASKALFMINELQAYLQGEVIQCSWTRFEKWIEGDDTGTSSSSTRSSRPGTASSAGLSKTTGLSYMGDNITDSTRRHGLNDPRALAEAHHLYLQALSEALFFTDDNFTGALQSLLSRIDHLIALFSRLQTVWESLDLQEDEGVLDAFANHAQDEQEVLAEMDRTRDAIEATLLELVQLIREIEKEKRSGLATNTVIEKASTLGLGGTKFVPWQARSVDRLIMKLDSLAGRQDEGKDETGTGIGDFYDDE
ncbi:hypothetical protein A1O1_09001 [Capronia coronata CBS 617.96]|uniref:Spindle pole body component n=1 Tax=Capronia coronata CBS 617.96 TaxID=1182541 RepID=W9XMP7_9EURO|nr:uncharacterized protein A1O1_09001 [Capronia coronata CBS 617.96]EXJ78600.1 hypothetical protein A1O1_09001 [Capronia coronata CBS 617.96]